MYDLLVSDILSDCLQVKSKNNNKPKIAFFTSEASDEPDSSDYSKIASLIVEAYREGSRNDIIFDLSGFLYHQNLKLEIAESIVKNFAS